ncbi:MAG: S41 family peptidase [Clostridia bacterium]|nr:S41 family peptidase [Clostridia bacterium]
MKKGKVAILCILCIILSSASTFYIGNMVQLSNGDKVVITRDQYDDLLAVNNEFDKEIQLRQYIRDNFYFDFDEKGFQEYMLKGLFESLDDPYSLYMTAEEYEEFQASSEGEYSGIGVVMSPTDEGQVVIVSPVEDTPADEAGILAGDIIIAVDGEKTTKENFEEIADMIRGEVGTKVVLTLTREGIEGTFDKEIIRKVVKLQAVKSRMLEDKIGYIRITLFDMDVATEFKNHLDELKGQGMVGLVLDLRGNPGGSVEEVTKIADEILGKQLIFYSEDKQGNKTENFSDSSKLEVPYVLLVDGGSASASEILAGAVKDTGAGEIIGEQTFGKGIIQILKPLPEGDAIKLTVSGYFTPNGTSIHGIGIEPTIVVPLDEAYMTKENPTDADDNQLQKAIEVIKGEL